MKKLFRYTLPQTSTEEEFNALKINYKQKALKEFIKVYNILDVKTITFSEEVVEDKPTQTVIYYVEIETSEL